MLNNQQKVLKDRLLKLDTASLSDAMDSLSLSRALPSIVSRNVGKKIAGPVFTVKYTVLEREENTFYNAGNYIDDVPEEYVVLVDNNGRADCTSWGNILTFKALKNHLGGTVVYGSVRDISEIKKMDYPLFSSHVFMVSGKNRVCVEAVQQPVIIGSIKVRPVDWLIGDDNGVLVVAEENLEEVISRAENVEQTEQRIIKALSHGENLHTVRDQMGYTRPWEIQN